MRESLAPGTVQSPHGKITTRRFGRFTFDAASGTLFRDGELAGLPPKAGAVLGVLIAADATPVTRAALLDAVWPDEAVGDAALTQAVYLVRRALATGGLDGALRTVPKRGYVLRLPPAVLAPDVRAPVRRRGLWRYGAAVLLLLAVLPAVPASDRAPAFPRGLSGEAARLYRLARYHWSTRTHDGVLRSVALFRAVIRQAPESALGYAGLADAELAMHDYWCGPPAACRAADAIARSASTAALRRDAASPAALTSAAQVAHVLDGDDARADALFRRAIAIAPDAALAHEWRGHLLLLRGDVEAARRELRVALTLDPVATATNAWLARASYLAHDYAGAVRHARDTLALVPDRHETRVLLGLALARGGDVAAARRAFDTLPRFGGSTAETRLLRSALPGARGAAALVRGPHAKDAVFVWLARGDRPGALRQLRLVHFSDVTERRFFALDPRLDGVRRDPRFRPWTALD